MDKNGQTNRTGIAAALASSGGRPVTAKPGELCTALKDLSSGEESIIKAGEERLLKEALGLAAIIGRDGVNLVVENALFNDVFMGDGAERGRTPQQQEGASE